MQQFAELDVLAGRDSARLRPKRKTLARRKITVRLSEGVCERLDVATDRPGVGKSMFVEAALDSVLNPKPSVEVVVEERFDAMNARFDSFERDMRIMAEVVALHARYQLAVTPPVPQEQQRDAVRLGDERFRILAEQAECRVRQHRPLVQETIERLHPRKPEPTGQATGNYAPPGAGQEQDAQRITARPLDTEQARRQVAGAPGVSLAHQRPISSNNRLEVSKKVKQSQPPKASQSASGQEGHTELPGWRLILSVILPFAAGYFLSFLFRTINASISPALTADFGLGAVETGLLASIYFLVFAGAQIPIGVFLDRYGPKQVQSVLLVIAAGGAALFGNADSFAELLIGRSMLGLGVAASLMAGLKAIVLWFPKERIAFVNGGMIMLGSLGAVTATAPTDWLLSLIGWRNLFEILTMATVLAAGLVYFVVPSRNSATGRAATSGASPTLQSIFADPRFLRIAPLSATCIGSAWAMQSLWAASWLADVENLDHQAVVRHLFIMALGVSVGALILGTLADRHRE